MNYLIVITAFFLFLADAHSQEQYFSISAPKTSRTYDRALGRYLGGNTNLLALMSGQTIVLVSCTADEIYSTLPKIALATSSTTNVLFCYNGLTITGPVNLAIYGGLGSDGTPDGVFCPYYITYKFIQSPFDVNKTMILPPSPNIVNVNLQSSSDLVNWTTATNGTYGGTNSATFFRISVQSSN